MGTKTRTRKAVRAKKERRRKLSKIEQLTRHLANSVPIGERTIWTKPDIQLHWNISEPTFWRYRRKGRIPPPDAKIGTRKAWRRETIIAAETGAPAAKRSSRPRLLQPAAG